MKERGFILITVFFLLLLAAVTALSLNVKTGMQARMAANQSGDVQGYFEQLAVIEQSLWRLTRDPFWRVPALSATAYNNKPYSRTVGSSVVSPDAVVISVVAPNASRRVNRSFRYHISTPYPVRKPGQVCIDGAGVIYFVDGDNHSVWKVDLLGAVTLVAGNGSSGFSGDGGPATDAALNSPQGVAVDGAGNVYIADTGNHRVRRVHAGIISTEVNKTGTPGSTGDGGKADTARVTSPQGVWVNSLGDIYVADTGNHRIRQVRVADNRKIYLVAGTVQGFGGDGGMATAPDAKLDSPRAGWVDALGNVYIADTGNHRIRKVTAAGILTTVAGCDATGGFSGDGGGATAARLNGPQGIWMDAADNIYIADRGNHRVRRFTDGGTIATVAGTGTPGHAGDGGAAVSARVDHPSGVCGVGQRVIISDTMNGCLRKVEAGAISTWPLAVVPGLSGPGGVVSHYDSVRKTHFLFIADQENHRIRRLDTATNAIATVAGTGVAGYAGDNGPATEARLNSPRDVCMAGGNLYIADVQNNRVRKVTNPSAETVGAITTVAGTGQAGYDGEGMAAGKQLNKPQGITADGAGNIYIADTGNHRIRKVSAAGTIATVVNTSGAEGSSGDGNDATAATVKTPQGVFVGGNGDIYIADTGNHRIRKVTAATGTISLVAGTTQGYSGDGADAAAAQFDFPQGLSADAAGNIYIADTGNHALRVINIQNNPPTVHAMAGVGTNFGYNGDNRASVTAQLARPQNVAIGLAEGRGRLFIGDSGNNRIRAVFLKPVKELYGP